MSTERRSWLFLMVILGMGIAVLWFNLQDSLSANTALKNELNLLKEQLQQITKQKNNAVDSSIFSSNENRLTGQITPTPKPAPTPPLANDPEVQERIRNYKKNFALRKYASLMEEIGGLTPEEFDQFLEAMRADSKEASDEQLKKILGDERYQKYQDHLQKMPDQKILNDLRNQLAYTKAPIDPEQDKKLAQIFTEERKSVESILGKDPNRMIAYQEFNKIPEALLTQKLQAKQAFYQKIMDRASSFLTREQSEALSVYLEDKMDIEDMNLLTAKKLKELNIQGSGFD